MFFSKVKLNWQTLCRTN